jgi:hypothetical protein
MDPDATYERWLNALAEGDLREAREAHRDLMTWINNGGFLPRALLGGGSSGAANRASFYAWRPSRRPRKKNPSATGSAAVAWYGLGFAVVSFVLLYINQRKITAALARTLPAPEEPPSR